MSVEFFTNTVLKKRVLVQMELDAFQLFTIRNCLKSNLFKHILKWECSGRVLDSRPRGADLLAVVVMYSSYRLVLSL